MKVNKEFLEMLENLIGSALREFQPIMPKKFAKAIAMYYPDAAVRKLYCGSIGIEMGEATFANLGTKVVVNSNKICLHIGNHVSIAPNCLFICESRANNSLELAEIPYVKEHTFRCKDIYVHDEVWIGANAIIYPGVTIGRCSIIGAGSIVMSDVEPYSIYAGVPAKKIRDLKTCEQVGE